MKVSQVSLRNFRRLEDVSFTFEDDHTVFVGPNNSGKTSAMSAFRLFFDKGGSFTVNDFTVSCLDGINLYGQDAKISENALPAIEMDIWLTIDPAREKVSALEQQLLDLAQVHSFTYIDSKFSNYSEGEIGHDDVIDIAAHLISTSPQLRRIIGQKYPYIFVDEAQDTHENVVDAFNMLCEGIGLPLVGYFGDPMQQIYDKRAGAFKGPSDSLRIAKEENFRCSREVIDLLNAFRKDIQQFPAGSNANTQGSVLVRDGQY
jgi:superfamily I DNA/RNA helicase